MFRLTYFAVTLAVATGLSPTLAAADEIALLIGNASYGEGPDVESGGAVLNSVQALNDAGVETVALRNADTGQLRQGLAQIEQMAPEADGLLVALSGRFVQSRTETWFLPVDSDVSTIAEMPRVALPLSSVLALLAEFPGRAVLALGTDDAEDGDFGRYVAPGIGTLDLPSGVTLATTTPRGLNALVGDTLAVPGAAIPADLPRGGVSGYLPRDHAFLRGSGGPDRETRRLAERLREDQDGAARRIEEARIDAERIEQRRRRLLDEARADDNLWGIAAAKDEVAAYEAYLDRYPQGRHAAEARAAIDAIRNAPRRAEDALSLNRDARREIQRDLSLLDYDTRGIDGIFGRGTRQAIAAWQEARNVEATGFLTQQQIAQLDRQAAIRAEELDRAARERRARLEQEDRAYWQRTGADGSERGLRAYLERFPDGRFADRANAALGEIRTARRGRPTPREQRAWRQAQVGGGAQDYQRYLDAYPDGAYEAQARAQLRSLPSAGGITRREREDREAAEAGEARLGLTQITRRAVEQRLAALDHGPGSVDGTFDGNTRRAIRRYQREAGLPVTGFLTQTTVVRLLADSLRDILR